MNSSDALCFDDNDANINEDTIISFSIVLIYEFLSLNYIADRDDNWSKVEVSNIFKKIDWDAVDDVA